MYIRETIKILDGLEMPDRVRADIYRNNALKLLRLNGDD